MTSSARTHSDVLYSVLFDGYELVNEQPEIADSFDDHCARILLTDDPTISSDFWTVVVVDPALPGDPIRSQRLLKIIGHPLIAAYTRSLYIDNSVTLRQHPSSILDAWLTDDVDLSVPTHSFRTVLLDEFDAVSDFGFDDGARVHEQLLHYAAAYPDELEGPVAWTALLARRASPSVNEAMRRWADHVLRYSRRDQLSFPVATAGLPKAQVDIDNFASAMHTWPAELGRNAPRGKARRPAGPLLAERRRLERHAVQLEAQIAEQAGEIERLHTQVAEIETLRTAVNDQEEEISRIRDEAASANAQLQETRTSLSWRITQPLRSLNRRTNPQHPTGPS